jgi:hypothetical protein
MQKLTFPQEVHSVRPPTALELTVPGDAFEYAAIVLQGPFPEGEAAIAQHPVFSYIYAVTILKTLFPPGEPTMLRDPKYRGFYIRFLQSLGIELSEYFQSQILSGEMRLEELYG